MLTKLMLLSGLLCMRNTLLTFWSIELGPVKDNNTVLFLVNKLIFQ